MGIQHRLAFAQQHSPGHAEMAEQHLAVVEMHQDVFRPAIDPLEPAPGDALGEVRGHWPAQIRAALHQPGQDPALQVGGETPANGFNVRQFRHGGGNVACCRAARYVRPYG